MIRSLFASLDSERLVRSQGVVTARFLLPIATWHKSLGPEPSIGDSARREFCDRVVPLARALPGVRSASLTTALPLNRNSDGTRIVSETGKYQDKEQPLQANFAEVYPDYFATL